LTIFSIDNQHEKGSKKNAMGWSTTAYFPQKAGSIAIAWSTLKLKSLNPGYNIPAPITTILFTLSGYNEPNLYAVYPPSLNPIKLTLSFVTRLITFNTSPALCASVKESEPISDLPCPLVEMAISYQLIKNIL
jgi:hypothetical protein